MFNKRNSVQCKDHISFYKYCNKLLEISQLKYYKFIIYSLAGQKTKADFTGFIL